MLSKIKNPDLAAIVTMGLALLVEVISRAAADESLLAQLPSWLGPLLIVFAASLRYTLSKPAAPIPSPTPAVPTEVDDEITEPIDIEVDG